MDDKKTGGFKFERTSNLAQQNTNEKSISIKNLRLFIQSGQKGQATALLSDLDTKQLMQLSQHIQNTVDKLSNQITNRNSSTGATPDRNLSDKLSSYQETKKFVDTMVSINSSTGESSITTGTPTAPQSNRTQKKGYQQAIPILGTQDPNTGFGGQLPPGTGTSHTHYSNPKEMSTTPEMNVMQPTIAADAYKVQLNIIKEEVQKNLSSEINIESFDFNKFLNAVKGLIRLQRNPQEIFDDLSQDQQDSIAISFKDSLSKLRHDQLEYLALKLEQIPQTKNTQYNGFIARFKGTIKEVAPLTELVDLTQNLSPYTIMKQFDLQRFITLANQQIENGYPAHELYHFLDLETILQGLQEEQKQYLVSSNLLNGDGLSTPEEQYTNALENLDNATQNQGDQITTGKAYFLALVRNSANGTLNFGASHLTSVGQLPTIDIDIGAGFSNNLPDVDFSTTPEESPGGGIPTDLSFGFASKTPAQEININPNPQPMVTDSDLGSSAKRKSAVLGLLDKSRNPMEIEDVEISYTDHFYAGNLFRGLTHEDIKDVDGVITKANLRLSKKIPEEVSYSLMTQEGFGAVISTINEQIIKVLGKISQQTAMQVGQQLKDAEKSIKLFSTVQETLEEVDPGNSSISPQQRQENCKKLIKFFETYEVQESLRLVAPQNHKILKPEKTRAFKKLALLLKQYKVNIPGLNEALQGVNPSNKLDINKRDDHWKELKSLLNDFTSSQSMVLGDGFKSSETIVKLLRVIAQANGQQEIAFKKLMSLSPRSMQTRILTKNLWKAGGIKAYEKELNQTFENYSSLVNNLLLNAQQSDSRNSNLGKLKKLLDMLQNYIPKPDSGSKLYQKILTQNLKHLEFLQEEYDYDKGRFDPIYVGFLTLDSNKLTTYGEALREATGQIDKLYNNAGGKNKKELCTDILQAAKYYIPKNMVVRRLTALFENESEYHKYIHKEEYRLSNQKEVATPTYNLSQVVGDTISKRNEIANLDSTTLLIPKFLDFSLYKQKPTELETIFMRMGLINKNSAPKSKVISWREIPVPEGVEKKEKATKSKKAEKTSRVKKQKRKVKKGMPIGQQVALICVAIFGGIVTLITFSGSNEDNERYDRDNSQRTSQQVEKNNRNNNRRTQRKNDSQQSDNTTNRNNGNVGSNGSADNNPVNSNPPSALSHSKLTANEYDIVQEFSSGFVDYINTHSPFQLSRKPVAIFYDQDKKYVDPNVQAALNSVGGENINGQRPRISLIYKITGHKQGRSINKLRPHMGVTIFKTPSELEDMSPRESIRQLASIEGYYMEDNKSKTPAMFYFYTNFTHNNKPYKNVVSLSLPSKVKPFFVKGHRSYKEILKEVKSKDKTIYKLLKRYLDLLRERDYPLGGVQIDTY